jgi:hypothetical protein
MDLKKIANVGFSGDPNMFCLFFLAKLMNDLFSKLPPEATVGAQKIAAVRYSGNLESYW